MAQLSHSRLLYVANTMVDDLKNGQLLDDVAQWIERYLVKTSKAPPEQWNVLTDSREFWEHIPTMIEALLGRS